MLKPIIKTAAMGGLIVSALCGAPKCIAQSQEEVAAKIKDCCGYTSGKVFEKLITVDVSPEFWSYISNPADIATGLTPLSSFAPELQAFAAKMGWGDMHKTISDSPVHEDENPLIPQMIERWQEKMSLKLVCKFKPANEALERAAISNLCAVAYPIGESQFKPASGKMFMTVTVSPAATNYSATITPDGTHFSVVVPAYQTYSQEGLTNALVKCGNTRPH
jgi:hypothetical protein